MSVQLSPVSILTEDWFTGWLDPDEPRRPDVDISLFDFDTVGEFHTESDDYALLTDAEFLQAQADLAYLHRDEDDSHILLRWNQPDDVLDELEQIELNDERAVWVERMTAFRRAQLHRLLSEYFGGDYRDREIVLRWEQKNGRWVPAEKLPVLAWIEQRVEERGSQLAGFASCAGTIRSKLTRKRIANDKTGQSGGWTRTYNAV